VARLRLLLRALALSIAVALHLWYRGVLNAPEARARKAASRRRRERRIGRVE
jgi:hypothetical protein